MNKRNNWIRKIKRILRKVDQLNPIRSSNNKEDGQITGITIKGQAIILARIEVGSTTIMGINLTTGTQVMDIKEDRTRNIDLEVTTTLDLGNM